MYADSSNVFKRVILRPPEKPVKMLYFGLKINRILFILYRIVHTFRVIWEGNIPVLYNVLNSIRHYSIIFSLCSPVMCGIIQEDRERRSPTNQPRKEKGDEKS